MSARAATILAGAALALAGVLSAAALPPCEHEDSPGPCYWDAEHRGNHAGSSFVNLDRGQR